MTIDRDVWAGLFFMGLAALGLWMGADLAFGSPARMGSGFLPKVLCWMLLGLGAIITLLGVVKRGTPMEAWTWGPVLAILSAVMIFGATLEDFGLELAILGAVMVGGVADPAPNRHERWLLAFVAVGLAMLLWPGTMKKITTLTGSTVPGLAISGLIALAILAVVLSHARRVELPVIVERMALALGLGAICTIIFVDGLGLTMKSMVVTDLWTAVKSAIKPFLN